MSDGKMDWGIDRWIGAAFAVVLTLKRSDIVKIELRIAKQHQVSPFG